MNNLEKIVDIQKFLIAGFMEYGHAQDYKELIPPKLFGEYKDMYEHLSNGGTKTPEYFEICRKIGTKKVIDLLERQDPAFITSRDTYIQKLLDWHVTEELMKKESPADNLDKIKEMYIKLANIKSMTQGGVTKGVELCYELADNIAEAIEGGENHTFYTTGIKLIDENCMGVVKGRTLRVSAYANTGKSALSYSVCNHILKQGAKVLYFSLEIPKKDLLERLVSNYYNISIEEFQTKKELGSLDLSDYAKYNLYVSSDSFTMSEIELQVGAVRPDVIFIDYVQLVKGEGTSEYEQMNDVARRIRKISSDYNVGVFDLSQVPNDAKSYKKGGTIPTKGSGELVAAANQVIVMEEGKTSGQIYMHLAKNRHGKKGISHEYKPNFTTCKFQYIGIAMGEM